MIYIFHKTLFLEVTKEVAWDFLSNPENLVKLTPGHMKMEILSGHEKPLYAGQMIRMRVSPIPSYRSTWVSEITQLAEGSYFVDEQRSGPYSMWHHQHHVNQVDGGVEIEDIIHYRVPFGWLGRLLHPVFIKPQLNKVFDYRTKKLKELLGNK